MKKSILASTILAAFAAFTGYAGGVISVNIANTDGGDSVTGATEYGLAPAVGSTWVNITQTGPNPFSVEIPSEYRDGTANDLEGVNATFTSSGSFGRYKPNGVTVAGDCPFFKRYIDDGSGKITVDISGIPYRAYKVIVYVQADWAGKTGGWSEEGPDFDPILVNDVWYTYDTDKGDTVAGSQSDYWGKYGEGSVVEGVNTLVVEKQVGSNLTIVVPARWPRRSSLCAFQIVEDLSIEFAPSTISVNFDGASYPVAGKASIAGLVQGYLAASSWNNMDGATGSDVALPNVWDGDTAQTKTDAYPELKVSWFGGDLFHYDGVVDPFLKGFLTDSDANPPSVTVSGIPFKEYDVIVYMAADWNWHHYHAECTNLDFQAVRVNGTAYTWDAEMGLTVPGEKPWGVIKQPRAALGINALRINGLSGSTLEFHTHSRNENGRGNIAAFQIVTPLPADFVAEDTIAARDVNAAVKAQGKEGAEFSLELPAGKAIVLNQKKPLVCSKLCIVSKGNILIDTASDPLDENGELLDWVKAEIAKIDISRVRGSVLHGWKMTAGVISVNFNSEKGAMASLGGFAGAFAGEEIPAASWNDMTGASGEENLKVWKGGELALVPADDSTVKLTWASYGNYQYESGVEDNYLKGYLDDTGDGIQITIGQIPFEKYDLYVIFSADWNKDAWEGDFDALKLNGTNYVWSEAEQAAVVTENAKATWGRYAQPKAELGVNTLRVKNLTDTQLSIEVGRRWNHRAGIAAIQIVEPAKKRRYSAGFIVTIR